MILCEHCFLCIVVAVKHILVVGCVVECVVERKMDFINEILFDAKVWVAFGDNKDAVDLDKTDFEGKILVFVFAFFVSIKYSQ